MLLAVTAVVWAPLAPRLVVALGLLLSPAYELDGVLPLWLAHATTLTAAAVALGACWSLLVRGGNQAVVTRSQPLFGLVIEPATGG